jgi:hypothetical protein
MRQAPHMTSEYVVGREAEPGDTAGQGSGGRLRGALHAVLRRVADGPPPWVAECGTPVAHIQGSWPPRDEASLEAVCPSCLSRLAG